MTDKAQIDQEFCLLEVGLLLEIVQASGEILSKSQENCNNIHKNIFLLLTFT